MDTVFITTFLYLSDTLPTNSSKKKKIVQATGNKSAMSMIKTDRQKVWNELRKLQKKQRKDVIEKRKRQKTKSAIGKCRQMFYCFAGFILLE